MKRATSLLAALWLLISPALAGTDLDLRTAYKGPVGSADTAAVATQRDLVVLGDGTGASKAKAIRAANPAVKLYCYVKAGGVRTTDAEWPDAQPLLWRQPNGEPYTQGQNGWAYADLQKFANQWAVTVVIPHVQATLAQVPPGTYTGIMVDNVIQQHSSLFVPNVPPSYDLRTYHDATLVVLRQLRAAFPGMAILPNGWQGWAPEGLRGEALGGKDPQTGLPWADGIWFEGLEFDVNGKQRESARLMKDLSAYLSFASKGYVAVWDEPGVQGSRWREAAGLMISTTGNAAFSLGAQVSEFAHLLVDGPPWSDWTR